MTRIKKKSLLIIFSVVNLFFLSALVSNAEIRTRLLLKTPGNSASEYDLTFSDGKTEVICPEGTTLIVTSRLEEREAFSRFELTVRADGTAWYNIGSCLPTGFVHEDCLFYMPGFWYRNNTRSPQHAPSSHVADSWIVREDRLSSPLVGAFNEKTGEWYTVMRIDDFKTEALTACNSGEVVLGGKTSIGFTGFCNSDDNAELVFGFPYKEAPYSYSRKLTLAPSMTSFERIEAKESRKLVWEIRRGRSESWSEFVATVWETSYKNLRPVPVRTKYTPEKAKKVLSRYFDRSYVDLYPLKYYSGVGLLTTTCESNGKAEVGFVGRVLLNAFNALEYGYETLCAEMVSRAESIFESYLDCGFTEGGLFREDVDFESGKETSVYSIRRQSEGIYAILNYLRYEKKNGRNHPLYERKIRKILDRLSLIQNADGSFPRKFDDNLVIIDASGGSTSSAVLPYAMAYSYFKDMEYLYIARKASAYIKDNIIDAADYFSSTLDANCEDKEASLYASTAMYYMYLVEKSDVERERYAELCLRAAYFALSWYYLWDVPFAQGQMLGDVFFKSRGWGNVSVENNHIDVFIFEFADVLDFLADRFGKPEFSEFTSVIRTSMLQLMPEKGNMFDIAEEGYYPEVVQHTNWDYGKNGKGFYNNIFAPGWTVASLWQMLSPSRAESFFME